MAIRRQWHCLCRHGHQGFWCLQAVLWQCKNLAAPCCRCWVCSVTSSMRGKRWCYSNYLSAIPCNANKFCGFEQPIYVHVKRKRPCCWLCPSAHSSCETLHSTMIKQLFRHSIDGHFGVKIASNMPDCWVMKCMLCMPTHGTAPVTCQYGARCVNGCKWKAQEMIVAREPWHSCQQLLVYIRCLLCRDHEHVLCHV